MQFILSSTHNAVWHMIEIQKVIWTNEKKWLLKWQESCQNLDSDPAAKFLHHLEIHELTSRVCL